MQLVVLSLVCACSRTASSPQDEATSDPSTSSTGSETTEASETVAGSETTEDDSTTDDEATSEETETLFGFPSDLSPPPECDPFNQDCPEGEKCVPYSSTGENWDANQCALVSGEGQAGDPCIYWGTATGADDCDESHLCWNAQDDGEQLAGTCMPPCSGAFDDPVCPPGSSCLIANDGSISVCVPSCDPLDQDCGAGEACMWSGTDFVCMVPSEDATLDEACGFANDCSAGQLCVREQALPDCEAFGCCAELCSLDEPQCASPGLECVPFFPEGVGPPQFYPEGLCVAPEACPNGCGELIADRLIAPWD